MDSQTLEYIIKCKNEGKVIRNKAFAIFGYAFLFVTLALLIINLCAPLLHIPFLLVDTAFCAMTAFVSWKFLCVEFEIVIGGGELTLTKLYGKSIRKRMTNIPLTSIIEIGLYDDVAYEKLCSLSLQKDYVAVSSMSAPTIYYALFDEGKDRCVLYFEIDEKGLKRLKQENPGAFRKGNIR